MKKENYNLILIGVMVFLFLGFGGVVRAGELHEAAQAGNIKKVQDFLKANPEMLNMGDAAQGSTPLHCAAIGGNKNMVAFLISKGAAISAKDLDGQTPLHVATNPDVAKLLVERGADVNAKDNYGRTPLHYAAYYGRLNMAEYFISVGASIDITDEEGNTPLHWAVRNGHKNVVSFLISKGADVNAMTVDNQSPLQLAKKKGYKEIINILLEHNAQ